MRGKTITLDTGGFEHCPVRADELLHDVFANLASNAIRHTRDTASIHIAVRQVLEGDKAWYRVSVEDDGPGIADESKEKIFSRMHDGSARGMGLGLFLVRSLVDSYGGQVWVEDRVAGDHTQGAKFVVLLPAAEE